MQPNRIQFAVFVLAALLGSVTLAGPDQREIAAIRKLYAATSSALDLTRTSIAANEFSTEGGKVTIYKDASGQVRRLTASFLGETGKGEFDYYLEGGKLRFLYERQDEYNHHIAEEGELKVVSYTEQRFYFAGDKLIEWLDEDHESVPAATAKYKEMERKQLETFQELLSKAR